MYCKYRILFYNNPIFVDYLRLINIVGPLTQGIFVYVLDMKETLDGNPEYPSIPSGDAEIIGLGISPSE